MKCNAAFVRRRGPIVLMVLGLALFSLSGCSSGGTSTGAGPKFDSELIAVAKKAKNRRELNQLIDDDKIKEQRKFVAAKKPSRKAKKKVR